MNRIPIKQVIVVEGKYDKIALEQVVDATILVTDGFGLFKNREKQQLLRTLAERRGLIVLTDSDGGGRQIRTCLSGLIPRDRLIHLYTPAVPGKEKRKKTASRSGILGVEGTGADTLRALFAPLAADAPPQTRGRAITKTDLYEAGLLGGVGSAARRAALTARLAMPDMPPNALLAALNVLGDYDWFRGVTDDAAGADNTAE